VEIEITKNNTFERTDLVAAQFTTTLIYFLLPLTTYTFTLFVVTDVGRSRPSAINGSTLSLSMLFEVDKTNITFLLLLL